MSTDSIAIEHDIETSWATATRPYVLTGNKSLRYQESFESNARTYPRRLPLTIARAEGIYVEDMEGRVFLDCLCGAGALALGHNHPAVIDAMRRTLDARTPLLTLDIMTPVKERFMRDVLAVLPAGFAEHARIQFCSPSGADGVEAAIKLVKSATGKRGIIAFQGSYHGMTHGALAVTSVVKSRADIPNLMGDVVFLPFPYDYRCPFGIGGEKGEQAILSYIEHTLNDPCSGLPPIAGVIVEVIQGEGGVIPASDNWMRQLRRLTAEHGIPLIIDEVQTGIGRTGNMFAFEQSGIIPDVVIISKSIGGTLPLSMIVYNESLDKWGAGAHVGTFRGNQLAMAAGSAVLGVIEEEGLLGNARAIGEYMLSRLTGLQQRYPQLADVRGRGMMVAVEIVNMEAGTNLRGSYPGDPGMAIRIQQECFRRGLIVELGGRGDATVRFLPPINIDMKMAATILDIFEDAITCLNQ